MNTELTGSNLRFCAFIAQCHAFSQYMMCMWCVYKSHIFVMFGYLHSSFLPFSSTSLVRENARYVWIMYVHACVCVCVCVYIYTYIHIYIHILYKPRAAHEGAARPMSAKALVRASNTTRPPLPWDTCRTPPRDRALQHDRSQNQRQGRGSPKP